VRVTRPKFSILIPTRDRPALLAFALQSAKLQTYEDFEVIVSDNFVEKPARAVFDEHADSRFRYVRPPEPVSMADNWEFASRQANGEHLTVLIDKTVLLPSTLAATAAALAAQPADIVSWWNEAFDLDREAESRGEFTRGCYAPGYRQRPAEYFDARAELARRFRLDVRRGSEGVHYGYGKICFGTFSAALLERIRARCGRAFYPLCPDYTSMLLGLAMADRALDLGRPGLMSINTAGVSNGARFAHSAGHARWFSQTSGAEYGAEHWPVPGVYASHHNIVAFDYVRAKERIPDLITADLDLRNLLLRTREDLDAVGAWPDPATRDEQYSRWESCVARMPEPVAEEIRRRVAGGPRSGAGVAAASSPLSAVKRALGMIPGLRPLYRALSGALPDSRPFANVIDAAGDADRRYPARPA
jgi:hypothetical protein